jgi:hypothetical protein
MKVDFFIENITFEFEIHGNAKIKTLINDVIFKEARVSVDRLLNKNSIEFFFSKDDPADSSSYVLIKKFLVNGEDFCDSLKSLPYEIDQSKHPGAVDSIPNNLYLGYIGHLKFELEHNDSLLSKAAWMIAKNEFEETKWPLGADNFRDKTFGNILRDAKGMFLGMAQAPKNKEILQTYNHLTLRETMLPINLDQFRKKLQSWINKSERISVNGLENFKEFTLSSQGVSDSLQSFMNRSSRIYMTQKIFWWNNEFLKSRTTKLNSLLEEGTHLGSDVLIEFPSPWYTDNYIKSVIHNAKQKNCTIAVDLTWLPMIEHPVHLDLSDVDEVYFSMNKSWPLIDLRPAFRWSRTKINDAQTFNTQHCVYPKIPYNIISRLVDQFSIDWTYNYYKQEVDHILQQFDLEKTNILWFTKSRNMLNKNVGKDVSDYYHLGEFICIAELLHHKGKYFW